MRHQRNALEAHLSHGLARKQGKDLEGGNNHLERWSECIPIRQSSMKNTFLFPSLIELGALFSGVGWGTWNIDFLCCLPKWTVECPSFHEHYEAAGGKKKRHPGLHGGGLTEYMQVGPRISSETHTNKQPGAQRSTSWSTLSKQALPMQPDETAF